MSISLQANQLPKQYRKEYKEEKMLNSSDAILRSSIIVGGGVLATKIFNKGRIVKDSFGNQQVVLSQSEKLMKTVAGGLESLAKKVKSARLNNTLESVAKFVKRNPKLTFGGAMALQTLLGLYLIRKNKVDRDHRIDQKYVDIAKMQDVD